MTEKIKSPKDLAAIRDRARAEIDVRTGEKDLQITVHMGTCGIAAGARDVLGALLSEMENLGPDSPLIRQTGCLGLCDREPMMTLTDRDGKQVRYGKLDAKKVHRIVQEHVVGGDVVTDFLIAD